MDDLRFSIPALLGLLPFRRDLVPFFFDKYPRYGWFRASGISTYIQRLSTAIFLYVLMVITGSVVVLKWDHCFRTARPDNLA